MSDTKNIILGSGVSFSKSFEIAESVVSSAIQHGIKRFDSAPSYGTEGLVGDILKKMLDSHAVSRSNLHIQTKIDAWQMQDGKISYHVEEALRKLNLDYLDALLIHWPIPEYVDDTWTQMRELKEKGVVNKIGICNVRIRQLKMYSRLDPDIIQIERHPLNTFQDEVAFCHEKGIEVQAYSPLCKMDYRLKESDVIKTIAKKYGKNEGQVILRWQFDSGVIPIFTTTKPKRVESYTQLNDFYLTKDEIEAINGLNENYKMYLESVSCPGF